MAAGVLHDGESVPILGKAAKIWPARAPPTEDTCDDSLSGDVSPLSLFISLAVGSAKVTAGF